MVGDIVLVKDPNMFVKEYKLARVKEVKKGADGHVRTVTLEYKLLNNTGTSASKTGDDLKKCQFKEIERSIHNIAVIVPVDWTEEDVETAVTQGINFKCAF